MVYFKFNKAWISPHEKIRTRNVDLLGNGTERDDTKRRFKTRKKSICLAPCGHETADSELPKVTRCDFLKPAKPRPIATCFIAKPFTEELYYVEKNAKYARIY